MYIAPDRILLQDDHELQHTSAADKTLRAFTNAVLVGVGLFPWFALANFM